MLPNYHAGIVPVLIGTGVPRSTVDAVRFPSRPPLPVGGRKEILAGAVGVRRSPVVIFHPLLALRVPINALA